MADEMLFTMAGSVATPAQMVSLEEAGLANRGDLQEWLAANPEILGPAVKIVTFDLEGPAAGAGPSHDRLTVLGLGQDGRLVVGELKWGRTSDSDVGAIKFAAQASRMLPESLAEHYARFHSRQQFALSTEEAFAELQSHAPDLSTESLRRPRIVLLAREFSPVLTSSVVWLSEVGLDLRLVQVSAFRAYGGGMTGGTDAPMISVKQVYPLRDVEDFTISPERALAREAEESKRRVQDASTVRRLVCTDSVAEGTMFTLSPRSEMGSDLRAQLEEWLHEDPVRRTAHWQNRTSAPLVWDADKASYTPAALVRHIVEEATGVSRDFFGTQWWRDPAGWTMVELAGPLSGGKGALYREFWSRWLERVRLDHGHWTQMTTLPAQNFLTMPSPVKGTHFGLLFTAGGKLRSDFFIESASQEASTTLFEGLQSNGERIEALYGKELSWEKLPDRVAYRVSDYAEGEVTDVENHDLYIDWMIASQEKLRRAIGSVMGGRPPRDEDDEEFDRR
ncbi:MAG TPA: DUF4268 domain-containing protein [Acidimicrobiales bacterium]|nr:DUF4268 domain-containing protein [Acidimicrobiales bacterium]